MAWLVQRLAGDWPTALTTVTGGKSNFSQYHFPLQFTPTPSIILLKETNKNLLGRMRISIVGPEFITVALLRATTSWNLELPHTAIPATSPIA
jgi:hypothetical protein